MFGAGLVTYLCLFDVSCDQYEEVGQALRTVPTSVFQCSPHQTYNLLVFDPSLLLKPSRTKWAVELLFSFFFILNLTEIVGHIYRAICEGM